MRSLSHCLILVLWTLSLKCIYFVYICTLSEIVILAVCVQLKQLKKTTRKNSVLNGIRTHDLAMPLQCLVSWKHTARITVSLTFIRSSYIWFSYIHIHIYSLSSGIWRTHNWPSIKNLRRVNTTSYGLQSFRYAAPRVWNTLPDNTKTSESLIAFKQAIHNITV